MNLMKIFKFIILLVAIVMFYIQFRTATLKLMNPPIIDATYETKIAADDLPLITICPVAQIIEDHFQKLEYDSLEHFLWGKTNCFRGDCVVSWGGHENLSFSGALKVLYDESILSSITIVTEGVFDSRVVFLAKFGFCLEITNYGPEYLEIIQLGLLQESQNLRLIFTDKNYRSFFMPDISSHLGGKILIQSGKQTNFDIFVKKTSSCNVMDVKTENFHECISNGIETRIKKPLGCIPPWLSDENQCNGTYHDNFLEAIPDFEGEFHWPVYTLHNSQLESECKTSCNRTKYLVVEGESISDYHGYGAAYISFVQNVQMTEKVANYHMFDFIIDVGSSMGLWLGLSVFGLYDLAVTVVDFIKNGDIIKKVKSVLPK